MWYTLMACFTFLLESPGLERWIFSCSTIQVPSLLDSVRLENRSGECLIYYQQSLKGMASLGCPPPLCLALIRNDACSNIKGHKAWESETQIPGARDLSPALWGWVSTGPPCPSPGHSALPHPVEEARPKRPGVKGCPFLLLNACFSWLCEVFRAGRNMIRCVLAAKQSPRD